MHESKYIEQYKRMIRWYRRFDNINTGREHYMDSDSYQDEVYSFFITCYHLKDWIANDEENNISKEIIENFVNKNEYIKISGDICNGIKHLKLNSPKTEDGAVMGGRDFSLSIGIGEPIIKVKYRINANGKVYDALAVATEVIESWKKFLSEHDKKFKSNL